VKLLSVAGVLKHNPCTVIAIPGKMAEAISFSVRHCERSEAISPRTWVLNFEIASSQLNAKPCFVPRNDAGSDDKNTER
jgi:hypothetical protein